MESSTLTLTTDAAGVGTTAVRVTGEAGGTAWTQTVLLTVLPPAAGALFRLPPDDQPGGLLHGRSGDAEHYGRCRLHVGWGCTNDHRTLADGWGRRDGGSLFDTGPPDRYVTELSG